MKTFRFNPPAFTVICLLLIARSVFADVTQTQEFFQTILSEQDESRLPEPSDATRRLLDASTLTPEEVRQVLPLAQRGVKSSMTTVRIHALSLIFNVTFRPDSASLLEPYVDDIVPFLTDADLAFRREAIVILGQQNPGPSPKAKAALLAHLGDRDNTTRETGMIAGALLVSSPSDRAVVRSVVNLARQRADQNLSTDLIRAMGLTGVTTDEALGFIRYHFSDPAPDTRLTCVEAIGRMPKNVREGFAPELTRLVANPDETQETRERPPLF